MVTHIRNLKAYFYIRLETYTVVILNYIFVTYTIALIRLILMKSYLTLFIITLLISMSFRSGIIIFV